jgi:hypothetical protein
MHRFRVLLLCLTLGMGSMMGVPMRAEEVEELMRCVNQPKVAHVLRDESDSDEDKDSDSRLRSRPD